MPVYEYECGEHGRYETFGPMEECNKGKCPKCGKTGQRKFSPCHVYVDFTPGWDPAFAKVVHTKKERERLIREKGLVRYKD